MPARQLKFALPGAVLALIFGGLGLAAAINPGLLTNVGNAVVVGRVIGGLFTLLGVAGLWALLTQAGRQPQFVADDEGLAVGYKLGHAEIPWSDVAAVGVGYKITPRPATVKLPRALPWRSSSGLPTRRCDTAARPR